MAEESEFRIKGAAQRANTSDPEKEDAEPPAEKPAAESQDDEQEQAQANVVEKEKNDSKHQEDEKEEGAVSETEEDLMSRYPWYKCKTDEATAESTGYCHYFVNATTNSSLWTEPDEPYWLYDEATGRPQRVGLQFPGQAERSREEVLQLNHPAEYTGYNPKIHGDYDPNADYAQYHKQKRMEEEEGPLNPFDTSVAPPLGQEQPYQSTMALNRFTGNTQNAGVGPDRHSDGAKSGRQMNAFFDVDAAANAHDGRSLKEERRNQKLSKKEVKELAEARKKKKQEKRMAFWKS